MRRINKLLSSTAIVSALVLGTSTVYLTANGPEIQAKASKEATWGYGTSGMSAKAELPWYKYEGYTSYDPNFTQDYNFVRALKYDNVTINDYKVDTDAKVEFDHTKKLYDTSVEFNSKDEVVQITFFTKPDAVSKETFKDAHSSNEIIDEGKLGNGDGTFVKYNTNNGSYTAFFDTNDNLMEITIGQ